MTNQTKTIKRYTEQYMQRTFRINTFCFVKGFQDYFYNNVFINFFQDVTLVISPPQNAF